MSPAHSSPPASMPSLRLPIGLALLTAALLAAEILLTRLFSVLFYPGYVFAVLSLAVLGLGLGAGVRAALPAGSGERPLGRSVAAAGGSLLLVTAVGLLAPPGARFVLPLLVLFPFFWSGVAVADLFGRHAQHSHQLYLADLVGAGLGAVAAIPLGNVLGVPAALLLLAGLLGGAALLLDREQQHLWVNLGVVAAACLGWVLLATPVLSLDLAHLPAEKPASQQILGGGELLAQRWTAFARADLIAPADGGPLQLYVDGAAGSVVPPAGAEALLLQDIGFFPFASEQPQRVFIIGPGGGLDVAFGLRSGATEIVAVEVHPGSIDLVRSLGAETGSVYDRSEVRVVVDEGRSLLQREGRRYDLIFLSQIVTLAAERSGYALVENTTYTVEAFTAYWEHLHPGGLVSLKLYDEPTLTRALAGAVEALTQQGLSEVRALEHVVVLLDASADPPIPLLNIYREPLSRADALSIGAVARQVGFTPLFLPHVLARPPLDAVATGTRSMDAVLADSERDLSAVTDDRPFFFQFERGLPAGLRLLAPALLIAVLGAGLVLVYAQRREAAALRWMSLYFAALAAGFMAVEIVLIQQTRLVLGHPTLAVTVVLATLLVGGGAGSGLLAGRRLPLGRTIWGVLIWMGLWLVLWPRLAPHLAALAAPLRVGLVVLLLLPLALAMGAPFPQGLRFVGATASRRAVAWAWAINGVMSVGGTVGAVVLALRAGYSWVWLAAGCCYALALGVALRLRN